MANVRKDKEVFKSRLKIVKQHLPTFYGVLYKMRHPGADMQQVYNVTSGLIVNWEILRNLIAIAKEYRPKKQDKQPVGAA